MPHASITTCVGGVSCEEARELRAIQALTRDDTPLRIRDRELEHGLCEVHGHCRSIHLGLLLVAADGNQLMRDIIAHRNREESIPSW